MTMPKIQKLSISRLAVHVAESRTAMAEEAAAGIANDIRTRLRQQSGFRIVFAAAPSQAEMLAALRRESGIDWTRVTAFHMDEYVGLPAGSPQRFGNWLRDAIFDHLPFANVHLLDPGVDPARSAADYAALLDEAPIDTACCGIGVNGHLAFNDPPADFDDPLTVKIVDLDPQCRQQQVDDRCFAGLDEVPTQALTMTIPALLSAQTLFCAVPGPQKREAVRRALLGPIDPRCPASALRRHLRCALFLDQDSAGALPERERSKGE
jgi:glucosamine-6-phosphate deaminase